jgi:Raf kinase inhibitor-like YbhB/YbcL family protein
MSLSLTSPLFGAGQAIPVRCTCDGQDLNPPLTWTGVPAGSESLALIVDDPDAPDPAAPRRTFVHWVVYDIPAPAGGIAEGASRRTMPSGAREGRNDAGSLGYTGPCPPIGRHRYFFKLYALDRMLGLREGHSKADVLHAMEGHVLASAELIGTYARPDAG